MKDSILQPEIFPLKCENPDCGYSYDIEGFIKLLLRRGLIYADCGDVIYQGFSCLECKHATLIRCSREEPIVDVTDFILRPCLHSLYASEEQIQIQNNAVSFEGYLKFKFFPAWDVHEFPHFNQGTGSVFYESLNAPLFVSDNKVERLRVWENQTGQVQLRRLYPDIPYYRNILTLEAPNQVTRVDEHGASNSDPSSNDTFNKNTAIVSIYEKFYEKSIRQQIVEKMIELGALEFNDIDFLNIYNKLIYIPFSRMVDFNKAESAMRTVGWEDSIYNDLDLNDAINFFLSNILKEIPYKKSRDDLYGWTREIEENKSLFVNAPMGIGKSHSIVRYLSKNLNVSAVIFMPTRKMCKEISNDLRREIAINKNMTDWSHVNNPIGHINCHFNYTSNEYLPDEVFFVEGITKDDCVFYAEIIEGYKKMWLLKKSFCDVCPKKIGIDSCRFLNWIPVARKSRIIIATHRLYDVFNQNNSLHYWERMSENASFQRNVFIVDEDLVINNCYTPIVLKENTLKQFCGTFFEFLDDYAKKNNFFRKRRKIVNNLNALIGRIVITDTSSVIPPLNNKFEIPIEIKNEWMKSYNIIEDLVPDYIDTVTAVHNLLDVVEHGIKYGVVIQKYNIKSNSDGNTVENSSIYNIFFPNPKKYDLSRCPPHVFFDGTKLENKFLKRKLIGVKFKPINITVSVSWKHVVKQNVNTDISASKIQLEQEKVMVALMGIFAENGNQKKYYIHTSKFIRNSYLDNFIKFFSFLDIKIDHYGNLRGKNSAKETDIHIMLGSYSPPDALEIAMGLEFIQKELIGKEPLATKINFWNFEKSNSQRKYNSRFAVIEQIAKAYRHAEQRQALARSRYLDHSVKFYIFAKEPVNEYETYLPEPIDCQYRADLFPPRKQRSDNKYEEVKAAIVLALSQPNGKGLLKVKESVSDNFIYKNSGIGRDTIRTHREQLEKEGFVTRVSPRLYALSVREENNV